MKLEDKLNQQNYELKISFKATSVNAQAYYDALALICEAWSRHKRLEDVQLKLELK
jgi:hypothetical protein